MKLTIESDEQTIIYEINGEQHKIGLYTKEAFELLSSLWLKIGWNQKYIYTFSWMGRPLIQLPEDLIRIQEVIYQVKPDVIIETGIAHGGSLIYYASLCKAMDQGRVIGIDIEIRPHNLKAIENHKMSSLITLVEGNSIAPDVITYVKSLLKPKETVMVILDSCHTKDHVLAELEAYHDLVTPGSYIIATDGIMKDLDEVPRGKPEWKWDNPATAAADFAQRHTEFLLEQPAWIFNESELSENVTHWSTAWLKKK